MDVSVIYVNWNTVQNILDSVDSIHQHTSGLQYEVIVVDNASTEELRPLHRDDIHLVRNDRNAGFGAGCNRGAECARGEFLLFLNPDTCLLNNALGILVDFFRLHPATGAAGPLTLDEQGKIHLDCGRALPSLSNQFLELSTLTFKFPQGKRLGHPYYSYWDHQSTREVGTLWGACMMLRSSVFQELGGFDDRFFLYCEEYDLCKRLWDAGYKIFYVHTARILHKSKQSTMKRYDSVDAMLPQLFESQFLYFRKHHGRCYARCWRLMLGGLFLGRFLVNRNPYYFRFFQWGIGLV